MKIIFVGTVEFSLKTFKLLLSLKADVVGLITKEKSEFNSDYAELAPLAYKTKIPVHFTKNINGEETLSWIREKAPDIIFCFGWSSLLKKDVLKIAPMGVVGYHPAELPFNRGRHPIIWALALGLSKTASTFFFMDEGADSGPILSQKPVSILKKDTAASLYKKITDVALTQIKEFVPKLQSGNHKVKLQDHTKANYWRKRGRKDGEIDWRMSADAIYNLVRALTKPYVGAHLMYQGQEIKVWKADPVKYKGKNIEAGKILKVERGIVVVKCSDAAIAIRKHEFGTLPIKGEYL
jgi:methionyl-tRNA formyltransferase